ncbi:MAG: hypothetical protein BWY09_02402 [Candidatus Hydrogenedentes bacterium ADurb.Bin179]|nr:MAG: hypothetical protein BWY09_02402 [Candidatus Hydrogenedentes bacterium ADurb.Bin179]
MYDLDGKELWNSKQPPGAWAIATTPVNWFGTEPPSGILVYGMGNGRPAVIWNGAGNVAETLPMTFTADRNDRDQQLDFYGLAADVWGDSRDEVVLFGSRGACIYTNARAAEIPTLYNENLYPGM